MGSASKPKYQSICETLEREIREGVHAPSTRFTTANEIQKRFQVSSITAKHALNRLRDLGLVERRRRHGTFVRTHPLPPKSPAGNQVSVIWDAYPSTHTGLELINAIESEFAKAGRVMVFRASQEDLAKEQECLEWCYAHGIQRVLMTPVRPRDAAAFYDQYRQRGMRIVFMDRGVDSPQFPLVRFDDGEIGRLAIRELKQAGYRKIALIATARRDTSIEDRVQGAMAECLRQGLALQVFPLGMDAYNGLLREPLQMKAWWKELSAQTGTPVGWFGVNEEIATALLQIMVHDKVNVPAACGVVGVGNTALAPLSALYLSSIDLPFRQLGTEAAQCLMSEESRHPALPPRGVVRRASTMPGAVLEWDEQAGRQEFLAAETVA